MNDAASALPVAAIVLNYAGAEDTLACVDSLLESCPPPRWIIVVDNASPDGSLSRIRAWGKMHGGSFVEADAGTGLTPQAAGFPRVLLLPLPVNGGYAAGNNAGMRLGLCLGAEAVWILNNDTVVTPGAGAAMWKRLTVPGIPPAGMCGALICYANDRNTVQCRGGGRVAPLTALLSLNGKGLPLAEARRTSAASVERDINYISGACVMVSRSFVETVGFMDEGYFLYCEERDWTLRAHGAFSLAYAPDAIVYHKEGASTGWNGSKPNVKRLLQLARSRLRLTRLHYPWLLPTVALGICFAALRLVLRFTRQRFGVKTAVPGGGR